METDGAVPGGVALSVTLMAKRAWTMELICSLFGILCRHPMDCRSKCQMPVTQAAMGHY